MRSKKHIAFLVAGLLCGLAASATYTFGAKTTVPVQDNGNVQITLDKHERVVTLSNMVIDDSTSGTLRIENTGTSTADYTLQGTLAGDAPLADRLLLTVLKDGNKIFPSGSAQAASLKTFNASPLSLGRFDRPCAQDPGKACDSGGQPSRWATGHRATLEFRVRLAPGADAAADNAIRRLAASETFVVSAVKATHGNGVRK